MIKNVVKDKMKEENFLRGLIDSLYDIKNNLDHEGANKPTKKIIDDLIIKYEKELDELLDVQEEMNEKYKQLGQEMREGW